MEVDLPQLRVIVGIEPCPGRELHDPGHHLVRDSDTHHTGPAVVANKCQVTVDEPTRGRVFRMHCERLSAVDLRCLTGRTVVKLTVKPGCRLIRDEVERMTSGPVIIPEPFVGREPRWVTGTVVVPEPGHGLAKQLKAPRWCREWRRVGVSTKIAEHHVLVSPGVGKINEASGPRRLIIGEFDACGCRTLTVRFPEPAQPVLLRAAFGERVAGPHPLGQGRKDVVVVAALPHRFNRLVHGGQHQFGIR